MESFGEAITSCGGSVTASHAAGTAAANRIDVHVTGSGANGSGIAIQFDTTRTYTR